MNPAAYPSRNTEELEAITKLESLLDLKFAKPDLKRLDTRPNTDGTIELVDAEQRPIGKVEVQVRKIPSGEISYQCPLELVAYSERISLPFILVCVDVENKRAYFRHLYSAMVPTLKPGQKSFVIKFDPKIHSISNETQYLRQWSDIIGDYNTRVSDYPKLRQIENRLNLSHISKEDRIYFQEFTEHVNRLLELDFPPVKDQFFKGIWKLGAAVSSADLAQVCFQLYSILPGDPDIRVSGISEHPSKPSIIPENAESAWIQGATGSKTIQYNWVSRSALKSPSAAAEDFVLNRVTNMLRSKSFPLFGERLATEYLFWYVDNYGQSLGIESANGLNLAQINYGIFVYLPAWASIAVPRFLGELVRLNRDNLDQVVHAIIATPFEHVARVYPDSLRPTKAEVVNLIESGRDLNPVKVRFTEASLQLLTNSADFLTAANIEWIHRPYLPRSGRPMRSWSGYTAEALRHNISKILVESLDEYRLFVQRNQISLKNSFYLHQHTALIYTADLTAWTESGFPVLKRYVVSNDDHSLPKIAFVDLSQSLSRLIVENKRLKLDGVEREILNSWEQVATDLFKDLPMLNQVYAMLTEDLQDQFPSHYFR